MTYENTLLSENKIKIIMNGSKDSNEINASCTTPGAESYWTFTSMISWPHSRASAHGD